MLLLLLQLLFYLCVCLCVYVGTVYALIFVIITNFLTMQALLCQ